MGPRGRIGIVVLDCIAHESSIGPGLGNHGARRGGGAGVVIIFCPFSFREYPGESVMKATIRWAGKASFEGKSESGHTVIMDGSPEIGGENRGPRPVELLLLGLGGCTALDVVFILRKGRPGVTDCVGD